MTERGVWALLLAAGMFSAAVVQVQAQVGADTTPTITTGTVLVRIPVMVQTRKGEPVFTLKAEDFAVTDDGVAQTVTLDDDTGTQPLALVVVVQTGGQGAKHLPDLANLPTYLESIVGGAQHRVALVAFDGEPQVWEKFTPDLDRIAKATHELEPGDNKAAILDALQFSVELLRKEPAQYRRAILLISETVDHGSRVDLQTALRSFGDTNTTIYSMAFNTSRSEAKGETGKLFGGPPGPAHGCMGTETELTADSPENRWVQAYDCLSLLAPPLRLIKMATMVAMDNLRKNVPESVARQTGGEYAKFSDAKGLERGLFALSNQLPNQYVLSFHPQAPHPGLHAIGLELKGYEGVTVTARRSYWAGGSAAAQP